jgi:hypothetical protein
VHCMAILQKNHVTPGRSHGVQRKFRTRDRSKIAHIADETPQHYSGIAYNADRKSSRWACSVTPQNVRTAKRTDMDVLRRISYTCGRFAVHIVLGMFCGESFSLRRISSICSVLKYIYYKRYFCHFHNFIVSGKYMTK